MSSSGGGSSSRKRNNPYPSRHTPYSAAKRRRPLPLDTNFEENDVVSNSTLNSNTVIVVVGVPNECSVLDLKSRFEMYGPISRTRMEPNGVAYVTFRSNDAAQSAVDAGRDAGFPVTLHSVPVQVMWSTDPVPQWREGVGRKDVPLNKLVRAEVPLRKHGRARGNKLGSTIVNPRDENNGINGTNRNDDNSKISGRTNTSNVIAKSGAEGLFRGREIVAYDDIL